MSPLQARPRHLGDIYIYIYALRPPPPQKKKNSNSFTSNTPTLLLVKKERAQIGCSNKDTLIQIRFLSFCLQLGLGVGHSRQFLGLGTPGSRWGWALQGGSRSGPGRGEEFRAKRRVQFKIKLPHTEGGEKTRWQGIEPFETQSSHVSTHSPPATQLHQESSKAAGSQTK